VGGERRPGKVGRHIFSGSQASFHGMPEQEESACLRKSVWLEEHHSFAGHPDSAPHT